MKNNQAYSLAGILDLPHFHAWDMRSAKLADLYKCSQTFRSSPANTKPAVEEEALEFYVLNHLISIIKKHKTPNQALDSFEASICRAYRKVVLEQSQRVMYYLSLITTREFRHAWEHANLTRADRKKLEKNVGKFVVDFHKTVCGTGFQTAMDHMSHDPNMTVGEFFDGVEYIFNNGLFKGGYGGLPWGRITNCLTRTLSGQYSQEMMIDTSYTLAHNNGPMHNKGMLYGAISGDLIQVLDVQRAGMIPELFLSRDIAIDCLKTSLTHMVNGIKDMYPNEIGGFVNWFEVEKRGAVSTLNYLQSKQAKNHPETVPADVEPNLNTPKKKKTAAPTPEKAFHLDIPEGMVWTGGAYVVDNKIQIKILKRAA